MRDPLRPLREAKVSDEITRPLAELLVVDELVGSGRATRLTEFNLGVAIRGVRRLKLSWEVRSRYRGKASMSGQLKASFGCNVNGNRSGGSDWTFPPVGHALPSGTGAPSLDYT